MRAGFFMQPMSYSRHSTLRPGTEVNSNNEDDRFKYVKTKSSIFAHVSLHSVVFLSVMIN